jgi:hypothetical protein
MADLTIAELVVYGIPWVLVFLGTWRPEHKAVLYALGGIGVTMAGFAFLSPPFLIIQVFIGVVILYLGVTSV